MRPIDADALKAKMEEEWFGGYPMEIFRGYVDEAPTIKPKCGKWVEIGENKDGTHNIKCYSCGAKYKSKGHANSYYTKQRFRFCPWCGVRMDG